jgi:hypothetical protein
MKVRYVLTIYDEISLESERINIVLIDGENRQCL